MDVKGSVAGTVHTICTMMEAPSGRLFCSLFFFVFLLFLYSQDSRNWQGLETAFGMLNLAGNCCLIILCVFLFLPYLNGLSSVLGSFIFI